MPTIAEYASLSVSGRGLEPSASISQRSERPLGVVLIDDSPIRCPPNANVAVVVLVPAAQSSGLGLLAKSGDLDSGKNLPLHGQQCLSVRARSNVS